jgi:hypothetical protein
MARARPASTDADGPSVSRVRNPGGFYRGLDGLLRLSNRRLKPSRRRDDSRPSRNATRTRVWSRSRFRQQFRKVLARVSRRILTRLKHAGQSSMKHFSAGRWFESGVDFNQRPLGYEPLLDWVRELAAPSVRRDCSVRVVGGALLSILVIIWPGKREGLEKMNDEWEYAELNTPRTAALREFERIKRGRSISDLERRLDEIEVEIIVARRRCERTERDRLSAAAQRPQVGLGAILCGGAGELVGRDFTG